MNRQKIISAIVVLLLIGATAGVLARAKTNQKLGAPGIKSRPLAGGNNLELLLPETVPGYTSEIMTNAEDIMKILPADSSYRVRYYKAPDGFAAQLNVVLMGSDRTSIHKPQICLTVRKLISTKQFPGADGQPQTARGIYVYWFVDGDKMTANPLQWMLWWMPRDLLLHGLLERWAYVSYFSACRPGQEEATYARMKKLIAETVPEFQLVPRPGK